MNWQGLKVGIQALTHLCRARGFDADQYFNVGDETAHKLEYHQIDLTPELATPHGGAIEPTYNWRLFDLGYGAIVETLELKFQGTLTLRAGEVRLFCGNVKASLQSKEFELASTPNNLTLSLDLKAASPFRFLQIGLPNSRIEDLDLVSAKTRRFIVSTTAAQV